MSYTRKPEGIYYNANKGRLMEHRGYGTRIYWSGDMLSLIRREFPTTLNEELAGMLGLSKDPQWLAKIWDERRAWALAAARRKGYPGCFKPGNTIGKDWRFKKKNV